MGTSSDDNSGAVELASGGRVGGEIGIFDTYDVPSLRLYQSILKPNIILIDLR